MVKSQSKLVVLAALAAHLANITPTSGATAVESVSITYEEGTPVASKVIQASPLSGQDGWTTVGGADASPSICVVSGLGCESRQAACFGSAYWDRQLQRSLDLPESDQSLRISACFYHGSLDQDPAAFEQRTTPARTQSHVILLGGKETPLLRFGLQWENQGSGGKPRLQVSVPGALNVSLPRDDEPPLSAGWHCIELVLDPARKQLVSGRAALVEQSGDKNWRTMIDRPIGYGATALGQDGVIQGVRLSLGGEAAVDNITVGDTVIDFESPRYSAQGEAESIWARRVKEFSVPAVEEVAYLEGTFPARSEQTQNSRASSTAPCVIAVGQQQPNHPLAPVLRFGLSGEHFLSDPGSHGLLTAWLSDGKLDYYGPLVRPQTGCDFRVKLDVRRQRFTAWFACHGDDRWFLLGENLPFSGDVSSIDRIRVEQSPGCAGVENFTISRDGWQRPDAVRPHPLAKSNRVVTSAAGFKFQAMRSTWREAGRHATIARRADRWQGFPDVAYLGGDHLICVYADGKGHGAGGAMLVRHSFDRGHEWSEAKVLHPTGVNCPRISRLRDGTLVALCDIYGGAVPVVLYESRDDGKSWSEPRWLDPVKAGGHCGIVISRIAELSDQSWLVVGSHLPGSNNYTDWSSLQEGDVLEVYRSTDHGASWSLWSSLPSDYGHALSEASIVPLPGGRLVMYARETRIDGYPAIKTFSEDDGKTWGPQKELPYIVHGRTCPGLLADGRLMMTFRNSLGRNSLWAWVGSTDDLTQPSVLGAHFGDSKSVALKQGSLHIDNDGRCGQFTQYFLRPPDSPACVIELTAEVKVLANSGRAASLTVPFVGNIRLFPDRVVLGQNLDVNTDVTPGEFHTYHVTYSAGRVTLDVDGQRRIETDKINSHARRAAWCPYESSPFVLAFGNEYDGPDQGIRFPARFSVDNSITGYSQWRRISAAVTDLPTGRKHQMSWNAEQGFPDQHQLDHIVEIDASVHGWDQGYSGWVQMDDDEIYVVNYTDDTAPAIGLETRMGVSWIRGTHLKLSDLPGAQPEGGDVR